MYYFLQRDYRFSVKNCLAAHTSGSKEIFSMFDKMKNSTEMKSSHAYKSRVRVCLPSVINSMLYARDPQNYIFSEQIPSPTVKEILSLLFGRRLKSQKDLFLFCLRLRGSAQALVQL